MKKPIVSVIMPIFNGKKYLYDSIDSILKQTYKNFEFIIIDDGSTDSSEKIVRSFKDKRVRLYKNNKNFGLPYSLNRAIKLSRGKYLVRMDQDDVSFPKRIATLVDFMNTHFDVGICGTAVKTDFRNHEIISQRPVDSEEIKATLLFHNVLSHSSVIMRKKSIMKSKLLYDPKVRNAEDYEFWTRCCWKIKITNLPIPLVFYRRHRKQMVNQPAIKSIVAISRNKMLKKFIEQPTSEELALHDRIASRKSLVNWKEVRTIENWLEKIAVANRQKRLVANQAMRSVLEDQWFNVCSESAKLGISVVWRYLSSPITNQTKRKWDHVFILLAKIPLSIVKL